MTAAGIDAYSPVDGRLLKSYATTPPDEIGRQIEQVRIAAKVWEGYGIERRLKILAPLKERMLAGIDELTECLVGTTGKVGTEVLLGEIYPLLDMLKYYEKNAGSILAPRHVHTAPLAFPDAEAQICYRAYGAVAVISPWNFPLQLTLYPLLTALIAGNGVVFKLSELSLPVGETIMALLNSLELPEGLVQWAIGGPAAGKQLIDGRPDLVFFTGGLDAGRAVMAAAARFPIPVILELGGKDAMVVFADAQLDRAVNAALYGAFSNSGQVCVSVERLYVEQGVFRPFLERLLGALQEIRVGHGVQGDLGAMTSPDQIAVVESHYRDALDKGAEASGPLRIEGPYVHPVVLWNVREDMRVLREESFGPLLAVMTFGCEEEVVEKVNASPYGLNASVWSGDIGKAEKVARKLEVGSWAVNDVVKNVGHPALPFGGVKSSGFGRYHGAEGLRSFVYPVSGLVSRSRFAREPNWFPYSDRSYRRMRAFLRLLFAEQPLCRRLRDNWRELIEFRQYAGLNLRQHGRNFLILLRGKRY
ncbi:MAG: aldehyde dehydrogenase family protein [Gammaproteobacteria bacterium]